MAAPTAASTATRTWLIDGGGCDPFAEANTRPGPVGEELSGSTASGATFQIPRSGTTNAMSAVGPKVLRDTNNGESG